MIERIAILGTGLLGTSVGLALRAAGFRGSIEGWNRSPEQGQVALTMGAIDRLAADPLQLARESEVVVLAVPIYATLDFMEKLSGVLGCDHLVTDVGSTKKQISEAAGRLYNTPERAAFLPGHPMAGKERSGAALARCGSFSRSGLAVYRRSGLHAVVAFGRASQALEGAGRSNGLEDHRSRPGAAR